jgi:hypothetical protein
VRETALALTERMTAADGEDEDHPTMLYDREDDRVTQRADLRVTRPRRAGVARACEPRARLRTRRERVPGR